MDILGSQGRVRWSFSIARIAGVDLRVHASFFLLLAWVGYGDYIGGGMGAMVEGMVFILLLFTCVVLHEFGHALAARAFGIHTPDITLLPIGGVARLERMPEKPLQELAVALAGPAVNVVIALGLFAVIGKFSGLGGLFSADGMETGVLGSLLAVNVMLVLFNLIPAFPMDGGRVLRALLAIRIKRARATEIAAGVGQAVAVIFAIIGIGFGQPILLLIAVFVFFGAQQEAAFAGEKEVAEETSVAQIMRTTASVLHLKMTVIEAARTAMGEALPAYPLVDGNLRLLGMVSPQELASALEHSPFAPVESLAETRVDRLPSDISVARARAVAEASPQALFPVVNSSGQLVGIVLREDLRAGVKPG